MFGLLLRGSDQRLDVGGREIRVGHDRERRGRHKADRRHVLERIEAESSDRGYGLVMWPDRISISVCPSGLAATSACVAVRPFAPGRFSTMIGTPSTFSRSLAISREIMSPVPPAVNPTSQRIGPEGQLCARALPASATNKQCQRDQRTRFIVSSGLFAAILADFREAAPAAGHEKSAFRDQAGTRQESDAQ